MISNHSIAQDSQAGSVINVPLTLDQVAVALRQLSASELETLELLMDDTAMKTIHEGIEEERHGKLREL